MVKRSVIWMLELLGNQFGLVRDEFLDSEGLSGQFLAWGIDPCPLKAGVDLQGGRAGAPDPTSYFKKKKNYMSIFKSCSLLPLQV